MDKKKLIETLYTGLDIAQNYRNGEGRILDPNIALAAFFSRRFSDEESWAKSLDSLIYMSQKDFPLLQDREIHSFASGKNRLAGYFYRCEGISKGLVLYVHGIRGQADDRYAIWQNRFVEAGYDVFAIDLTASGRSGGLGIDGLHQGAIDVSNAFRYVRESGKFPAEPVFLFGHSWGGYSVVASTGLGARPQAIAALSGFDSPLKEMLAMPKEKLGMNIDYGNAELEQALKMRCGEHYDLSASASIMEAGVPLLLAHGDQDSVVPLFASTYQHVPLGFAQKELLPGKGHMDIFFDPFAAELANKEKEIAQAMWGKATKDVSLIPEGERQRFQEGFDKRMTSLVDEALFHRVDEFFLLNR